MMLVKDTSNRLIRGIGRDGEDGIADGVDEEGGVGHGQGTYTLGRFLASASILCTVMGADQSKESFPYPSVGSTCLCYCSSQKSRH